MGSGEAAWHYAHSDYPAWFIYAGSNLRTTAQKAVGKLPQRGIVLREGFGLGYKIWLHSHMYLDAFQCSSMCIKPRKFKDGRRTSIGFHAVNRGSNPLGDAKKIKLLREIVGAFFVVGQICPTLCPTDLRKK
jgi:hypothetical protein